MITVGLTRSDSIGLTLVAESALLSLTAVLAIFGLLIRNAFRNGYIIKRPADLYMISLFAFDLVMAIGHVIDIKWVHEGQVASGAFCTAQGAIQQFGEMGSSLATLAIAIHTFVVVLWGKLGNNFIFAYCVVAFDWLFVILFVALGVSLKWDKGYEIPDSFWCWINPHYEAEEITGEYLWLWTTMIVSLITYTLLFLWSRGNLTVNPDRWWDIRIHRASVDQKYSSGDNAQSAKMKARSLKMIAYPFVFTIIVIPFSAVRFKSFSGGSVTTSVRTGIVILLWTVHGQSTNFACDSSMDIGKRADVAIRAAQNSMVHGLQTISVPALNILVLTTSNFDTISRRVYTACVSGSVPALFAFIIALRALLLLKILGP